MSKSKCKHISYRNEKIPVEDGYVTIEGKRYLVVDSLEGLKKHFIETKARVFKSLDDVTTGKKYLNAKCIFDLEISLNVDVLNDFSTDSDLLIFSNSIFLKKVTIKRGYFLSSAGNLSPDGSYKDLTLSDEDSSIPNFAFRNAKFEDECLIEIYHTRNNLSFIFDQCHFAKKLKIRNSEQGTQELHGTADGQYKITQETKLHLDKLRLMDCSANDGAYLRIGFVSVKDFLLSNLRLPQNAELNIGDCHFEIFKLRNFRNIGKFKLYKINILDIEHNYFDSRAYQKNETEGNEKFQIDNTSIGKTDFQSVNIGSFDHVIMFDNIFTEIDYTNLIWGDNDIEVRQYDNFPERDDKKIEIKKLEKQQDTYRTLKNVASKNNDQPQAIKFFAKEMDCYHKIVENKKKYPLSDRATLLFNKYTNDFGLDFWLPIRLLLCFSIFLYIPLYSLSISDSSVNVLDDLSKFVSRFFIFLNPTHKVNDVFGGDWSGWVHAIDFIFRIIEGLLIYQTIQAFRKYSRKL